jgi:N-acetylneuraminic acid mutarotase
MSKKLLLTLLVLSSSLLAFSQGTWTSRDTLPYDTNAMIQGIQGFSIGNYGYAGLGENSVGKNLTDLWQFDPSNNSWAKKASFPGSARVAPASFVIGNAAYLVTGSIRNFGTCVTECWQYNATTDTWAKKANFPGTARTYAVGFAIDSLGYVGTGANELSDFRKDFYAYHPSTDSWTRIADFPRARDGSCGFGTNGKGYVCFGQDSTHNSYKDMWEYDPVTNTWIQKTDNTYPLFLANGFVICNNIYIGYGDSTDGIDDTRKFWKYNTVSDTWTQEGNIPGTKRIQGTAFSIGDTGYSGFGCDTIEFPINTFYKFYAGDSCNITTDFINHNTFTEISIYPNPIYKECSINLPIGFEGTPLFSLFSMEGVGQKVDICGNNLNYTLKRNSLASGVYILSISYGGSIFYKKLIITN